MQQSIDNAHGPYASPFEQSRVYGQKAIEIIKAHPVLFVRFCASGAVRTLFEPGLEMFYALTGIPSGVSYPGLQPDIHGSGTRAVLRGHPRMYTVFLFYEGVLIALYSLFAIGIWKWRSQKRGIEGRFLLIGALYFLCLSSLIGNSRFRIPLMPFVVAGAVLHNRDRMNKLYSQRS
jgi:hypothetical protein